MSRRSERSQISDCAGEKSEAVSLRSAVENGSEAKVNSDSGSKLTMPAVTEVRRLLKLIPRYQRGGAREKSNHLSPEWRESSNDDK